MPVMPGGVSRPQLTDSDLQVDRPSCSPTWILSARFTKHRRPGLRHGPMDDKLFHKA